MLSKLLLRFYLINNLTNPISKEVLSVDDTITIIHILTKMLSKIDFLFFFLYIRVLIKSVKTTLR